jgi:integrase
MAYEALPAFLVELRKVEAVSARTLEFLILTASRTGEVIGAVWDEIDTEAKVWAIPGPRMKGGLPHRVPLTERAIAILDWARGLDPVMVFPGFDGKPMDLQAMFGLPTILKYHVVSIRWITLLLPAARFASQQGLSHYHCRKVFTDATRRLAVFARQRD